MTNLRLYITGYHGSILKCRIFTVFSRFAPTRVGIELTVSAKEEENAVVDGYADPDTGLLDTVMEQGIMADYVFYNRAFAFDLF